jgi:hypothetical protein
MMNLKKGDIEKVQQALASAYKTREKIEVGDAWENRVMFQIRGLGPLTSRLDFTALFERYFWRFAPAAALTLLVLGGVLYQQIDFLSDCEMARAFLGTRFDDSLFQILGAS